MPDLLTQYLRLLGYGATVIAGFMSLNHVCEWDTLPHCNNYMLIGTVQ